MSPGGAIIIIIPPVLPLQVFEHEVEAAFGGDSDVGITVSPGAIMVITPPFSSQPFRHEVDIGVGVV